MLGGPRSGEVHPKPPRADAIAGWLVDPEGDCSPHHRVLPGAGLQDVEGQAEVAALHLGEEHVISKIAYVAVLSLSR